MYCPNCVAHNQDQTKFCRSCGLDLRAVGAALKAQLAPPSEEPSEKPSEGIDAGGKDPKWLKRQNDGVHGVARGSILAVTSKLLGVALALFSHKSDWIIIWLIFCSWLLIWGAIEIGTGIGNLIQARMMRRRMERLLDGTIAPLPAVSAASATSVDTQKMPELAAGQEISAPPSITEQTTAPLPPPGSRL